ncbi:RNA polymerase sigma factor [Wenyingzhuangia sp. IMCC45467]
MILKNDLIAFEKLYKEHFKFLCLVSFQITKDEAIAKDIVQDFFVHLWSKEKSTDITTSFKSYASKAIKNLSLQQIEKSQKAKLKQEELITKKFEEPTFFEHVKNKKAAKVRELMNKIPEARRNIFISHVIDGLSYVQIAEMYNISVNTVKTQMKRSYAFLRTLENEDVTAVVLLFILISNS